MNTKYNTVSFSIHVLNSFHKDDKSMLKVIEEFEGSPFDDKKKDVIAKFAKEQFEKAVTDTISHEISYESHDYINEDNLLVLKFYIFDNNKRDDKSYMQQELICHTNWNFQYHNAVIDCLPLRIDGEVTEGGEASDDCPVGMFINITEDDAKHTIRVSELISRALLFMIRVCPDKQEVMSNK